MSYRKKMQKALFEPPFFSYITEILLKGQLISERIHRFSPKTNEILQ